MRIGIDISQTAYDKTGVGNYLSNLVSKLLERDNKNEYILFFSSLRRKFDPDQIGTKFETNSKIKIKKYKLPLVLLDLLWNKLHIVPIEWFVGNVDWFITSDWTEPPTVRAKKATILYDLIVYKHPEETDKKIVSVQKRKLEWVKKKSDIVFCISESTKSDAIKILGLDPKKVKVVHPGISSV